MLAAMPTRQKVGESVNQGPECDGREDQGLATAVECGTGSA